MDGVPPMTHGDEPKPRSSRPVRVADSVTDWIDATAEEEGVSRDELLDDLMGSYWTLKEVVTIIEQDPALSGRPADDGMGGPGPRADLDDVSERLRALESVLDTLPEEPASSEDLRALDAERAAFAASMTDRHAAFEARVEEEFGHARALFEHLLQGQTVSERRLDDLSAELAALADWHLERDRADELRDVARRAGLDSATCEGCGVAVEVAGLRWPTCPGCNRTVVAVEPAGGWLRRRTGRLVVSDEPTERSDPSGRGEPFVPDGTDTASGPDAPGPKSGTSEPVDIEWVLPGDANGTTTDGDG